jgi:hypothetical protein
VPLVTREKSTWTWSASSLSDHECRKEEKRSEISGEGISLWVLGILVMFKALLGNETGGAYAVHEDLILPGARMPAHVHYKRRGILVPVGWRDGVDSGKQGNHCQARLLHSSTSTAASHFCQ